MIGIKGRGRDQVLGRNKEERIKDHGMTSRERDQGLDIGGDWDQGLGWKGDKEINDLDERRGRNWELGWNWEKGIKDCRIMIGSAWF